MSLKVGDVSPTTGRVITCFVIKDMGFGGMWPLFVGECGGTLGMSQMGNCYAKRFDSASNARACLASMPPNHYPPPDRCGVRRIVRRA